MSVNNLPPFQVKHSPLLLYWGDPSSWTPCNCYELPLPGCAKAASCLSNAVRCNGVLWHWGIKLCLMCDICKLYSNDIIFWK